MRPRRKPPASRPPGPAALPTTWVQDQHTQQLRDPLARHVAAGRRITASARRPARSGRKAQAHALNTTEVREWAKAQGIDVKDRGRIPAELIVKFKAATRE